MTRARDLADIADKDISGTLTLDDIVLSNDMSVADNGKVQLGAGPDLEIYSDGTYARIMETGGLFLVLDTNGSKISLTSDNSNNMGEFIKDGAVQLFHSGSQKFSTTSSGVDVTGTMTADGLTVDGTAEIRSTGPTQLLIEDTDNGFAATTLSVENGGRDFHINPPQDIVLKQGGTIAQKIFTGGDISFYADNGTTQGLYWDASTQRLGLGTTSPSQKLSVVESGGSARMELLSGTSGISIIDMGDTSDADIGGIRYENTNNAMLFRANNDERLRITSGGSVGIGTPSPATTAHIQTSSGNPELRIESTGANYATMSVKNSSRHYSTQIRTDQSNAYVVRDETAGANRFSIDTSGNVGIGKTPVDKLDIKSGDIRIQNADQTFENHSQAQGIQWTQETDADVARIEASRHSWGHAPHNLNFYTRDDASDIQKRLIIDYKGRVTMPYQAYIVLQGNNGNNRTWNQNDRIGATDDGTAAWSVSNFANVTYNSNTGSITVPADGVYAVYLQAYYNGGSPPTNVRIQIRKNGAVQAMCHNQSISHGTLHVSALVAMSATNYIDFQHVSGGDRLFYEGVTHTYAFIQKVA